MRLFPAVGSLNCSLIGRSFPPRLQGSSPCASEWKRNFLWFEGEKVMFEGGDVELKEPLKQLKSPRC